MSVFCPDLPVSDQTCWRNSDCFGLTTECFALLISRVTSDEGIHLVRFFLQHAFLPFESSVRFPMLVCFGQQPFAGSLNFNALSVLKMIY